MKKMSSSNLVIATNLGIVLASFYPLYAHQLPTTLQERRQVCIEPIAVIFDLGNVLIETNRRAALWQLGPRRLFSYLLRNHSIGTMKKQLYTTLNRIDGSEGNPYGAKDPDGTLLPNLFASWLRSEQPNAHLLAKVDQEINAHPEWFNFKQEQQLILATTRLAFDPAQLAKTCYPISDMISFAQECKRKNYRLYILSNWDAESFELLAQKYKELFALFDNIIISGHVHTMKPEAAMFEFITRKIPAQQCIFIDDQQENVDAARTAGMHAILTRPRRTVMSNRPDMQKLRAEFAQVEKMLCGCTTN